MSDDRYVIRHVRSRSYLSYWVKEPDRVVLEIAASTEVVPVSFKTLGAALEYRSKARVPDAFAIVDHAQWDAEFEATPPEVRWSVEAAYEGS